MIKKLWLIPILLKGGNVIINIFSINISIHLK